MRRRTGAVPVEGQWPLRRELQMREEVDSESDLRLPQVPHRDDAGQGLRLRLQMRGIMRPGSRCQ